MRHLILTTLLLLCGAAMPAAAQTGSVQVSLTIVEPAQAIMDPQLSVRRTAGGQVQLETHVNLRGAVAWSLSRDVVLPATLEGAAPAPAACGAWTGSAAPAEGDAARRFEQRVTARARCDVAAGGTGSAQAPLVIVLAAN